MPKSLAVKDVWNQDADTVLIIKLFVLSQQLQPLFQREFRCYRWVDHRDLSHQNVLASVPAWVGTVLDEFPTASVLPLLPRAEMLLIAGGVTPWGNIAESPLRPRICGLLWV